MLQNGCFLDFSTAAVLFSVFFLFYNFSVVNLAALFLLYLRNWPLIFIFSESMSPNLKLIWRVEAEFHRSLFWIWLEPSCIRIRLLFKTAMPLWGENNKNKQIKSWFEICHGDSAFNPVVCRSHELPLMHTEAYRERFWVFNYAFIKAVFLILCEGKLIQPC